jgi:tetratricopeptide (TPR) repeat protein
MKNIMYKKFSKKKPETKIWLAVVTATVILMVFILGCYKKINDGGNPYSMSRSEQSLAISEEELTNFSSSIRKIDGHAESHYKMALYFQKQKKHKFAIEELKRTLQLNPLLAKAYNAMGISYDKLNRYNQAVSCYQSAIKLDPNLDYVYNNLGYSYMLNNNLDLAIEAFHRAIELKGNNRYRNNLALAYILNDQYNEAYEQFKIVEDDTKANEKLAAILYKLGKVKDQQYLAKDSNPERNSKELDGKKPKIVRKKINYDTPESSIKAVLSEQRLKHQKIEDTKFSINDEKILHSDVKRTEDRESLDETDPEQSHVAARESSQIADTKIKTIKKPANQEFQSESLDSSDSEYYLASTELVPEVDTAGGKLTPNLQLQSNAGMKLTLKGTNFKKSLRSEDIIVEVEIEVANGNGVNGAAMKFGNYLKSEGFKVAKIVNANSFEHATTKILYCHGNMQNVTNLLEKISISPNQGNIIEVKSLGKRIKIIMGKDLIKSDNKISKAIIGRRKS